MDKLSTKRCNRGFTEGIGHWVTACLPVNRSGDVPMGGDPNF